jgi:hypothetical protein
MVASLDGMGRAQWFSLVIVSGGKGLGARPLIGPEHQQPSGKELSGPPACLA